MTRSRWQFILMVIIAAFAFRVAYVSTLSCDKFYFADSLQFNEMAVNFLNGNGLSVGDSYAFRMPLYPLFLAVSYRICGVMQLDAVRIAQSLISALTILFIYLTAVLVFNEAVGKLSAIIASIYPFFIYYSGAILTETLYIFLISITLWFFVKRKYIWGAVFIALSTLVKAEISGFMFLAILYALITVPKPQKLNTIIAMMAVFLSLMSPWVIGNYIVLKRFVPLSTMGGRVLWEGNNPQNLSGGPCHYFPLQSDGLDEVEIDRMYRDSAIKTIKNNPKAFLKRCGRKFLRFWNVRLNTDNKLYATKRNNIVSMVSFLPVLVLFTMGLFVSFVNRDRPLIIYLFILYTLLINLVFVSSLRYRLPIEMYLIMFASYALYFLFSEVIHK